MHCAFKLKPYLKIKALENKLQDSFLWYKKTGILQ